MKNTAYNFQTNSKNKQYLPISGGCYLEANNRWTTFNMSGIGNGVNKSNCNSNEDPTIHSAHTGVWLVPGMRLQNYSMRIAAVSGGLGPVQLRGYYLVNGNPTELFRQDDLTLNNGDRHVFDLADFEVTENGVFALYWRTSVGGSRNRHFRTDGGLEVST